VVRENVEESLNLMITEMLIGKKNIISIVVNSIKNILNSKLINEFYISGEYLRRKIDDLATKQANFK